VGSSSGLRTVALVLGSLVTIGLELCASRLQQGALTSNPPDVRRTESFIATAYCTGRTTTAGTKVTVGVVAADPALLPIGSVIAIHGLDERYGGTYTVLDTGARVHGHRVDIYMRNCDEALRFGRRRVEVDLVRTPE